jgi:predicted metal-dependent hydrolase
MEIPYKVIHRKVKYPRLEFKDLQLLVILPMEINDPFEIIEKRKTWIQKKWSDIQEAIKQAEKPKDFMIFGETYIIENSKISKPTINHNTKKIQLNQENTRHMKIILNQLKELLNAKAKSIIEEYQKKLELKPNKILIKRQYTKWASCSDRKNISLNIKLICLPENMVKYVIYHEITHLKHKKHNYTFWQTISQEFPNYKKQEQNLREYWFTTEFLFQNLTKQHNRP